VLTGGLPLPSALSAAEAPGLASKLRRLPNGVELEISALPDEVFIKVFGADLASILAEADANAAAEGLGETKEGAKRREKARAEADARHWAYCERVWRLPAAERWTITSLWYNEPAYVPQQAAVKAEPPPEALRSAMDLLREQCGSDKKFAECASLILKYASNAAGEPSNSRFRTIRTSAKAFTRLLAPYPAASDCLQALGFQKRGMAPPEPICDGDVCRLPTTEESGGVSENGCAYVLSDDSITELPRLVDHLSREVRIAELRGVWPSKLHPVLPDACGSLEPELLDRLSKEISASHFGLLLDHSDNARRIESTIRAGAPAVETLISQLVEVRSNLTMAARSSAAGAAAASQPVSATEGRVRNIGSPEEWYDLLMDENAGLIVADFGAPWCAPCHAVKPLFAELSLNPEFASVTFCYLDSELLPQIMGDNSIDSFPTFKFFRDTEEEDLPVVGGDIDAVEARIRSLLASGKS